MRWESPARVPPEAQVPLTPESNLGMPPVTLSVPISQDVFAYKVFMPILQALYPIAVARKLFPVPDGPVMNRFRPCLTKSIVRRRSMAAADLQSHSRDSNMLRKLSGVIVSAKVEERLSSKADACHEASSDASDQAILCSCPFPV